MSYWSILWRLLLLTLALSLIFGVAIQAAYGGQLSEQAIFWKPTILWLLIASTIWIASSASSNFVATLLFGRKFNLPKEVWLSVGHYTACFFLILGLTNSMFVETAKFAPQIWVGFKLSAVPIGLLILSSLLFKKLNSPIPKEANPSLNSDTPQESPRAD
jgi:intracellular septation protein A